GGGGGGGGGGREGGGGGGRGGASAAVAPRQAMSTLITLVEPGMLTAVPAVMTTRSPGCTRPLSPAASRERPQMSSTSVASGIGIGVTPHSSAIWRSEYVWCVQPMIGRRGRRRATADAVRPVKVGTTIARAASASAMSQAALDMACPIV